MKPSVRIILAAAAVAACLFIWLLSDRLAAEARREVTLNRVEAVVADSLDRKFITPEDVKDWMDDYGTYMGLRLDSVDLCRVETLIDRESAVRKSQAWLTGDGTLHISVTQREPVVRFQSREGGFYADRDGFLFPLQNRHTARVPVVDGDLPLHLEKGFKGEPESEAGKAWVSSILSLVRFLETKKEWAALVGQVTVLKGGNLVIIPRDGNERFLIGTPTDIEAKFDRIRKYYEGVAPLEQGYRTVDVRYAHQIVCKKH